VLNRSLFTAKLNEVPVWDIIIIGGGATGLGIALDAASRGYATLLLEQSDFAKGTSSRSTKLVHGGVRYLAQGNIRLVYDALHERGLLEKNAAHLVKRQAFTIPCYTRTDVIKYLTGLKIYDWMSGRLSFGRSNFLNRKKLMERLPGLNHKGLKGAIEYYDGQFDDARLAVNLAQTGSEHGAVLLNYCRVKGLIKEKGKLKGVVTVDLENRKEYHLHSKTVINATGVFVDAVLDMDEPGKKPLVRPSQGIHLVVSKNFLRSDHALMIPKTKDGRVLFAVPWHNHILLGTTDTPVEHSDMEPLALDSEIRFILDTVKQYFASPPQEKDVLAVFAGLRPLAAPKKDTGNTKEISRDHKLWVSASGLISITGGKWTTYRKMAEHAVDEAIRHGGLPPAPCTTEKLKIHGCTKSVSDDHLSVYGTDAEGIRELIRQDPSLGRRLTEKLPYVEAEVVWAVRHEMARTIEDVLARRLRALFLDAAAAIESAPVVAVLMQKELDWDEERKKEQVREFTGLAQHYLIGWNRTHDRIAGYPVTGNR
jgi:glycerol-3-phosphate dehydrogenase